MSEPSALLRSLSTELVALAAAIVPSTAIVTGQTKDFNAASGSAWLFDDEHLVTNRHVVETLVEPIWVRFPGEAACRAEVRGTDPYTDLALLRVECRSADPLPLRPGPAALGELCFAFGSPLGEFPESMSMGIVSGLDRELPAVDGRAIYDVIQTDAAINPGNSGGPLVSAMGDVIGVNTAGIDGAANIGFAVPSPTVLDIATELRAHGQIERASLGVSVASRRDRRTLDERIAITGIRPTVAGPFEVGDVILEIAGTPVHTRSDLFQLLRRDAIGASVPVTVERDGRPVEVGCRPTLMNRPA